MTAAITGHKKLMAYVIPCLPASKVSKEAKLAKQRLQIMVQTNAGALQPC